MGRLKIEGGFLKGRFIIFPDILGIRPLTSYIKKAIFDTLGDIEGLYILDGFCGSGIFGIEAISRGAEKVVFVESSHKLCSALRKNLIELGIEEKAYIVCQDITRFFKKNREVFDVVFLDPPFTFEITQEFLKLLPGCFRILILRRHKSSLRNEKNIIISVLGEPSIERVYSDSAVYFFRSFLEPQQDF